MSEDVKLSHTAALILASVGAGCLYGFDIMESTGLPSGTVYPALRRLEQLELIQSRWEKESRALAEQRPARKYYKLTVTGTRAWRQAVERYPLLQHVSQHVSQHLKENV